MLIGDHYKPLEWEVLPEYLGDNISPLDKRTIYGKHEVPKDRYGYLDDEGYYITDYVLAFHDSKNIGPEIIYKINSDGFRSNHFKKINSKKINVLTAGCSNTFGEAMPIDFIWRSMLKAEIPDSDFYDVSSMAASTRLIVKNILTFIRKYGSPDFIFVVFPDLHRDIQFNKENREMQNCFPHTMWIREKKTFPTQSKFTINYVPEYNIFNNVEYIRMLEDICNALSIKLFWQTWSKEADQLYSKLDFLNYIPMPTTVSIDDEKIPENKLGLPYWKFAKDNNHFGSYWHRSIADSFSIYLKEVVA